MCFLFAFTKFYRALFLPLREKHSLLAHLLAHPTGRTARKRHNNTHFYIFKCKTAKILQREASASRFTPGLKLNKPTLCSTILPILPPANFVDFFTVWEIRYILRFAILTCIEQISQYNHFFFVKINLVLRQFIHNTSQ